MHFEKTMHFEKAMSKPRSLMGTRLAMSRVAERLQSVVGDVWEVPYAAARMQQRGLEVIRLCVGDPDFDTSSAAQAAVIGKLQQGRTHYSSAQGEFEFRKAIAETETRRSGRPCDSDQIVVFPGGTNALYSVLNCLLNPEDELIVPEPMYIGYCGLLAAIGCQVTHIPLNVSENFSLDTGAIKALVTDKTRVLLLNTPGNPAGNMISPTQLIELAEYCHGKGIWLVCDEVYAMITFDRPHVSLRSCAKQLDNVVIVNSMSKSHAMTGWRIGWVIAPRTLVASLVSFTDSIIYGCPQFIQDAAAVALRQDDAHVADMRDEYRARRDYIVSRINDIDGIRCQAPAAGMFVMADVSASGCDGGEFARSLLQSHRVSVVPGGGFGKSTGNFVRITLAQPIEVLAQAFDRIETFMQQHLNLSSTPAN